MYCVHRSTTAAVRLSNVLVKARTISIRGIRTSNLGLTAVEGLTPTATTKLDEILPEVADFPARHIGPRKHDAKAMLAELGYKVSHVEMSK